MADRTELRRGKPGWSLVMGTAALAALAGGCGVERPLPTSSVKPAEATAAPKPTQVAARPQKSRPTAKITAHPKPPAAPPFDVESIIVAQRKRIMGRKQSLEHVRRVATTIRPMVDCALDAPAVQDDLRALASSSGMTVTDYKKYFAGKQAADLMLESGGDPNARSVADAIGVAQFLAGTAQGRGLKVNVAASRQLGVRIAGIERQLEWLAAQPEEWSRAVPPELVGVKPAAAPAADDQVESSQPASEAATTATSANGATIWTREQWIAYRNSQRDALITKRRQVDERYDPAKAITVQTRYLLELTRRYGGVDWALQAYHGGEGGAARTMSLFAGSGARSMLASRSLGYGMSLPYSELYPRVTPNGTPAAFSYLFGRSDDHRYYWWKVLGAERALDLYAKDPAEFERQWQELKPGYNIDVAWYKEPEGLQYADAAALKQAYASGELVRLPAAAIKLGVRTADLAPLAPGSAPLFKGLRPEAMGALLRIAHIYRSARVTEPLVLLTMVQSAEYRALWDAANPPPPLPPDTPRDPEYHTTGLVFDLRRPARDWDRKVLEYALSRLYDGRRISWRLENGRRTYHVVVNPEFRDELVGYARHAMR